MNGTEKQINLAKSIESEMLPILESALNITLSTENRGRRGGPGYSIEIQETAKSAIRAAINHQDAGDWIDWRNQPVEFVLMAKYQDIYAEEISQEKFGNPFTLKKCITALINQTKK